MKTDIHPHYVECKVHCSCGNEFTTRSTVPSLRVELCSECHPFFTGKQKLVDTGGRVDRFNRRLAKATPVKGAKATKKVAADKGTKKAAADTSEKAEKAEKAEKKAAKAEEDDK
jgi:large subunit ribosomal protein L31